MEYNASRGVETRLCKFSGKLFRRLVGKHIHPISAVPVYKAGHHYFLVEAREVLDPKFATKSWLVIDSVAVHRQRQERA